LLFLLSNALFKAISMNNWEKTLERFHALGGVAENVRLGEGSYGRGLFPKDYKQPIKMSVPKQLLVPTEWLQLDEQENLVLSDGCGWADEVKAFYLDYQHDYGIAGSLMQNIMGQQSELFNLPESVKAMLIGYGVSASLLQKPTRQACLEIYKNSRRALSNNQLVLMPLVELVNHDEHSKKTFDTVPTLGISGKFSDEILVHYGMAGDAVLMFEAYRFSAPKTYAFSGALSINLGSKVIKISRFVTLFETIENTNIPKLKVDGDTIHLSCLAVGSLNDKSSPKKVFTKLMQSVGMPAHMASNVFDGIVDQNQSFFLRLFEELKPLEGTVIENMRSMARNQLIPLGIRI
jgi:hypothetical protein